MEGAVSCHTTDCHLLLPQCEQAPNTDIQGEKGVLAGCVAAVHTHRGLGTKVTSSGTGSKEELTAGYGLEEGREGRVGEIERDYIF